jgi:hypothetical protein
VTIAVLANDTDPDGDPLTLTGVTQGKHGTVVLARGMVTYTPEANFTGTDDFTYTVSDGHDTDTARVTVTVACPTPTITYPHRAGHWRGHGYGDALAHL